MEGIVDIYMPDFKLWASETARRYLKRADYPDVARETIVEMHRQVGDLVLDEHGMARRGLVTGTAIRTASRSLDPSSRAQRCSVASSRRRARARVGLSHCVA
jgi:uncharacterized Fe-S radical SAM superfamily protein PflX